MTHLRYISPRQLTFSPNIIRCFRIPNRQTSQIFGHTLHITRWRIIRNPRTNRLLATRIEIMERYHDRKKGMCQIWIRLLFRHPERSRRVFYSVCKRCLPPLCSGFYHFLPKKICLHVLANLWGPSMTSQHVLASFWGPSMTSQHVSATLWGPSMTSQHVLAAFWGPSMTSQHVSASFWGSSTTSQHVLATE